MYDCIMANTTLPAAGPFAQLARDALEARDWDEIHAFATVTLEEDGPQVRTYAGIDPALNPDAYPLVMMQIAREDITRNEDAPYAFMMEFEAFGVLEPPPSAPEEEKEQFDSDRRTRNFHSRPDAEEIASVYIADVNGRLWTATKYRVTGQVEEQFYDGAAPPPLGGQFIRALLAIAHSVGVVSYGTPGPFSMRN